MSGDDVECSAEQRDSRAERESFRAEQCIAESVSEQSSAVQCSAEQRVCAYV